jgi:ABC-type multidrug transport system ATPase subunit
VQDLPLKRNQLKKRLQGKQKPNMKLLRAELIGKYKGLENQTFDFTNSSGDVLALIGLNGSGKSQFLEMLCETFAWLERVQRPDFKAVDVLNYKLNLTYEISTVLEFTTQGKKASFEFETGINEWFEKEQTFIVENILSVKAGDAPYQLDSKGIDYRIFREERDDDSRIEFVISSKSSKAKLITSNKDIKLPLPSYVIGYSSGQNENLQRSFLKNAFQYYEVMRVRGNYSAKILESNSEVETYKTTQWYSSRHPGIEKVDVDHFKPKRNNPGREWENLIVSSLDEHNYFRISDRDTPASSMIYLDYDTTSLLMASLLILEQEEINYLLPDLTCTKPNKIEITYDLRGYPLEDDIVKDILQLHRAVDGFPAAIQDTVEANQHESERFGIDFISARLEIDLSNPIVLDNFKQAFFYDPLTLFKKLYRIQLLGIKHWSKALKESVSDDNFIGNVKKPLKGLLPIKISNLIMSDDSNKYVNFDDFSDGEHQLIQIISASRIFKNEQVLYVFDEPETHLNPSWRTYFHGLLTNALDNQEKSNSQVLLSTHSPFMVSSLNKDNVFVFERSPGESIEMSPAQLETYGTAFEVLIQQYFELESSISQTAIKEIKERLENNSDEEVLAWIESSLGDSMDKAYLLRKLQ